MARMDGRGDAGQDLRSAAKAFYLAGFLVNADGLFRLGEVVLLVAGLLRIRRIEEEVDVRLADMQRRLRESLLAGDGEAAGVVAMDVRRQDVGDLVRGDADRLQTVEELASVARPEEFTRAGIDQNLAVPILDQEGVDRGLDGILR